MTHYIWLLFDLRGAHGQRALMDAKVCMLGSTAIASETLKNLVLPGTKSIPYIYTYIHTYICLYVYMVIYIYIYVLYGLCSGIGHLTVVDSALVEASDLGQNFFLEESELGKLRSEAICRSLVEMNPDVKGTFVDLEPNAAVAKGKDFFRPFSLVIACQITETMAIQLSKVCEALFN